MDDDYTDEFYEEEITYTNKRHSKQKPKQEQSIEGQIIQRTGKIMPCDGNSIKLVVSDSEIYGIIPNTMSIQLAKHLYKEMMVQGKVTIAARGEKQLSVMNYI